ncbi:hypothetical protein Cgig2_012330 [Carnegiea gigantea]|uniref:Endonuclease/exonuclease/phosphatase domain-containing protein n=1 Tax=Carnegiea gigantea TaxID=171969 RepID=A0A9Q1GN39_9CARY|nr:hypothetical protein Cgig2_012330 [Carnegiea gigantea]
MSQEEFPISGNPDLTRVEHEGPNERRVSTYTAMVNPDEDLSLKYVEATVINGMKCAKIEYQDMFGHLEKECMKKTNAHPEWRVVGTINQSTEQRPVHQVGEDGYETPRRIVRISPSARARDVSASNSFQLLLENEIRELINTTQLIHYAVTQLCTQKHFKLTIVCGFNKEETRQSLWQELKLISQQTSDAWCVIGDFNAVLHLHDRIGGDDIQDIEVRGFVKCINECELTELRSCGNYYSWSNRDHNG